MSKRSLLFTLCAVLITLPLHAALKHDAIPPSGETISAVKTWSDLASLRAFRFETNAAIRLGVEAVRAPRWSGVMLYCMTDGYDSSVPSGPASETRLGPLLVEIKSDQALKVLEAQRSIIESAHHVSGRLLFIQLIPIECEGKTKVTVRDREGHCFGVVTIEATAAEHPWSPLAPSPDQPAEIELADAESSSSASVSYKGEGLALPILDGLEPAWFITSDGQRGPEPFQDDDRLPSIMRLQARPPLTAPPELYKKVADAVNRLGSDDYETREKASAELVALGARALQILQRYEKDAGDPEVKTRLIRRIMELENDFRIRYDRNEIIISMKNSFVGSSPETFFLARWWVNGKPYIPAAEVKAIEAIGGGLVNECTQLRLKLELDAPKLGAKPGDTIGVQLLHCPGGWNPRVEKMEQLQAVRDGDRTPRVSNKIEFTLPD